MIAKIFETYEALNDEPARKYLGGSAIGKSCERELWYGFRWALSEHFDGRILRLFQYGHQAEPRFIAELKKAGISVYQFDEDGEQFKMVAGKGHFGGHADGKGEGFPGDPGMHLLEFKTHNDKSFKALKSKGVASKPQHVAQVQVYMGLLGLKKAYYLAENKNDSDLYDEVIEFDQTQFDDLMRKAERIIFADSAPPRIAKTAAWFECKFCNFTDICHGKGLPNKSCRTCASATPIADGAWHCDRHGDLIPEDFSRTGCGQHLFNPTMINSKPLDSGDEFVRYEDFTNIIEGSDVDGLTSAELATIGDIEKIDDVLAVKKHFGGTVVAND